MWIRNSLLLLTLAQAWGQTASVAGRVVDSAGAPVRRALVTLNAQGRGSTNARATTAEDGTYILTGITAGKYTITADKPGYLRGTFGARSLSSPGEQLTLADAQTKSSADIVLRLQGVITGRVVDEFGDPVERASISAFSTRTPKRASGYGTANDKGEFRIAKLAPGNYRLQATLPGGGPDGGIVTREPGRPPMVVAPTYFPGVLDAASAGLVKVQAGEERTGAEIRMKRSVVVTVSGRMVGDVPAPNDKGGRRGAVRVVLLPVGAGGDVANAMGMRGPGGFGGGGGGQPGADGAFAIRNVRPGEYQLAAISADRGGPKIMAKRAISVGQTDLNDIGLQLAPPLKVEGRFRADSEPPFEIGTVSYILQAADGSDFGYDEGKSAAGGAFTLNAVSRDKLLLIPEPPAGTVVKAIYAAGQPLPGLEIDFSTVAGPLEIVLSNKPGALKGAVEGVTENSPPLVVWAARDGGPLDSWNVKKVKVPAGTATFALDTLRPGNYRIAAFEESANELLRDEAVWTRFQDRVVTLKIGESETAQTKLKVITGAELDAL